MHSSEQLIEQLFGWQPPELMQERVDVLAEMLGNDAMQRRGKAFREAWPRSNFSAVAQAIAESLNWLMSQGLVIYEPEQNGEWMRLTRRAQSIKTKVDWEAYRKGGTLPVGLLQPHLAEKVHHLFVRGDHDIAVFQAFKEVEVAVRAACGHADDLVGRALMQKAFAINDGPLRDMDLVAAEREAEVFLFAGAIGHAKNPTSHREVSLSR